MIEPRIHSTVASHPKQDEYTAEDSEYDSNVQDHKSEGFVQTNVVHASITTGLTSHVVVVVYSWFYGHIVEHRNVG